MGTQDAETAQDHDDAGRAPAHEAAPPPPPARNGRPGVGATAASGDPQVPADVVGPPSIRDGDRRPVPLRTRSTVAHPRRRQLALGVPTGRGDRQRRRVTTRTHAGNAGVTARVARSARHCCPSRARSIESVNAFSEAELVVGAGAWRDVSHQKAVTM